MARYFQSTTETLDSFLKAVTNTPFMNRDVQELLNYGNPSDNAMSTGMVNCVGGKPYISNAFNDMYNKMKTAKLNIELQTVILDNGYYGHIEAHFSFTNPASPDKVSAKMTLQRSGINLSGTPFARFHLDTMFNLIRDYFIKRDRSWTANRMGSMQRYAERNETGPINRLLYEVAVGRRKKIKKATIKGVVNSAEVYNEELITKTESSKDYKFPDYEKFGLKTQSGDMERIEQVIDKEKNDIAKNNVLADVSNIYEFYNLFGTGTHTAKDVREDGYGISSIAQLGIIDVVDGQVTWKHSELKQIYDTKNADIIRYFKETQGWRLSFYSLNEARISFQFITLNNDTYNLSFGGNTDTNIKNLMKVLKANGLLSELYTRLGKYVTEDMKADLSEILLKDKDVEREGRLSIRDLLSNI